MKLGATEEPAPESAEQVRKIIKELDDLLDIQWFPTARVNARGEIEGRYALVCRWPQVDSRWEMYHNGEIGEPFDRMAFFEEDGDQISWFAHGRPITDPASVIDRVLELLADCDNEKQPWKARVRDAFAHNAALREARQREAKDEIVDEFRYKERKVRDIAFSNVSVDLGGKKDE